jgi:Transposase IS116/IS110/IS902 family
MEAVDESRTRGAGETYAAERRQHLLQTLDQLQADIEHLNQRVEAEAGQRPQAVTLMTHPGVGPVTALAMVLPPGPAERFASPKQVASYFGLIPSEHSSGGRQQLGRISKQGSSFLRFLLVEAGQSAARYDAELGRFYRRLAARKHRALAKVAVARKLAMRLYLMLREDWNYAQLSRAVVQASPSHSVVEPLINRLSGQPASPRRGEFEARIMGASPEETEGGARRHRKINQNTTLVCKRQNHTLSKRTKSNRFSRSRKGVCKNRLTIAPVVRDRI